MNDTKTRIVINPASLLFVLALLGCGGWLYLKYEYGAHEERIKQEAARLEAEERFASEQARMRRERELAEARHAETLLATKERQQAESAARGLAEQQAQAQAEAQRKAGLTREVLRQRARAAHALDQVTELEAQIGKVQTESAKTRKRAGGLRYEAERAKLQFENKVRLETMAQNLVDSLSNQRAGNPRQDAQLGGQLEEAVRQRDRATAEATAAEAAWKKIITEYEKLLQEADRLEATSKRLASNLEQAKRNAEGLAKETAAVEAAAGMTPEQAAAPQPPPAPPPQD